MKMQFASCIATSAFISLVACSQATKTPALQGESEAAVSREHCLSANDSSTCFLEVEKDSKSTFYATSDDYQTLLTNPLLADLNLSLQKVSDESYASLFLENSAPSIVYNEASPESVDVYANASASDSYTNSKGRRIAGGIGGGFTGALGGAATGATIGSAVPVLGTTIGAIGGFIVGGIGGGFTGAATFWNGKTNLVYHFGSESSSVEVQVKDVD